MEKKKFNPGEGRLSDLDASKQRALFIATSLKPEEKEEAGEQLEELLSLGETYGLEAVGSLSIFLRTVNAGTFLGKGKVEEIRQEVEEKKIDLVVFNSEISPQQQRNLEKAFSCIVIDRTELILAVFAQRAQSREAKIQIELASCRYQLPRLRRLWTHLSRQRTGGAKGGFLKGEGEKQIEIDRRILRKRIDQLQKEISAIKQHRVTQRSARKRSNTPSFAIVGYTNVGKSTLLKALTDADVLVENKLFATLDTKARQFTLPNNQSILLVDTVGFIRNLPHLLVAAFRSTLEEAVQADILLHIVDVSHPACVRQAEATRAVLKELGAEKLPTLTVLNKVDAAPSRLPIQKIKILHPRTVEISALHKTGFEDLLARMMEEIARLRSVVHLRVPQSHYALVSELRREGNILDCVYEENDILLEVEIPRHLEKKVSLYEVSS